MPQEQELDPYAVLGLDDQDASSESDIRRAYRRRAIRYHPDKDPSDAAARQFHLLNLALELLTDGERRRKYDAKLQARRLAADKLDRGRKHRHDLIQQLEQREQAANTHGQPQSGHFDVEAVRRANRATREELGKRPGSAGQPRSRTRSESRSRAGSRSPKRSKVDDPYERRDAILARMRAVGRARMAEVRTATAP